MPNLNIFQLKFSSPLHLSRGKLNSYESSDTVLHSDTLKSAMLATALQIFDFTQTEIKAFWDSFQVSSTMPYYGDTYYFPRPLSWQPKVENAAEQKDWNKVEYLQLTDFQDLIKENEIKELPTAPKFFEKEQTQRVQIKYGEDSVPFYIEKLYFEPQAGLYFIVDCDDTLLQRLEGIMELLGDNGIGLQRNIGNGHFTVERKTIALDLPESDKYMSLSLYCPSKDELEDFDMEHSFYKLQKRGGWVSSSAAENMSYRKKSVYMFQEGSVFQTKSIDNQLLIKGKSVEITPNIMQDQPVWREGRGVFIPIR
jgi:CRISPR-associated protein Csm4